MPILNMVGGGSKGGNIGEPLNLTVTSAGLDATITWEDNEIGTIPPTSFAKSELVRKVGSAPTSPSDGTLVVTETVKDTYKVSGYTDSGLTDGTTYYYRVFSYSDLGGISYCDAESVTIHSWQPGANTIAYYPLNGDLNDYSGNGYDMSVKFGTAGYGTSFESGKQCAVFDASGNMSGGWGCQTSQSLTINGNITVSYCAKIQYGSWTKDVIVNRDNDGFLWMDNITTTGKIMFHGNQHYDSTTSIPNDTWCNVTCVVNNGTVYFYINGTLSNSLSYTYGGAASAKLSIGYSGQTANVDERLKGSVANIIIEDRAWSAEEVLALAQQYGFAS